MDEKVASYRVDPLIVTKPLTAKVLNNFKSLRLEALRTFPQSSSSTLEAEEGLSDSQWEATILDPAHQYLICHTQLHSAGSTISDSECAADEWAEDDAWVGMLCLSGPYRKDEYAGASLLGSTAMVFDEHESGWYINALFMQPDSRCKESATAIHEAVLDYLRFQTDQYLATTFDDATGLEKPKKARLAGILRTDNDPCRELFESLAGRKIGWANEPLRRKIAGLDGVMPDAGSMKELMQVTESVIEC